MNRQIFYYYSPVQRCRKYKMLIISVRIVDRQIADDSWTYLLYRWDDEEQYQLINQLISLRHMGPLPPWHMDGTRDEAEIFLIFAINLPYCSIFKFYKNEITKNTKLRLSQKLRIYKILCKDISINKNCHDILFLIKNVIKNNQTLFFTKIEILRNSLCK